MRSLTDRLVAFNQKFGRPVRACPSTDLDAAEIEQLLGKLEEEVSELRNAIGGMDLASIADGLGDTIYVIAGISVQFGIDIDKVLDLVHRSNMTKVSSGAGEAVKGRGYRRPALEAALVDMRIRHRQQQ